MKLYEKTINNVKYCKPSSKIIIIKDGMQIFNPTEEMILEDGWVEYIPQGYVVTDEEILKMEKEHIIDDIINYDSSNEVNIFHINGMPIWLDKATRTGLQLRFQAEKAIGKTETSLWYDGYEFKLPLDNAMTMLYYIEVYASACYDNTQRHIHNIKMIDNIEELKSYDYKEGYPDKYSF
jgi:hypothetical protein